jgi:hypothetical protein
MGMTGKDEVSVEIKDTGLLVKSSGEAAGRLSNALADLLSPLTEGAGYLGDSIRIYRTRAVIVALEKAYEFAKERGLRLGPVPPKFLVQWLENASVEGEEAELADLWAKLLVSASKRYKSGHISYVDLLRKIGSDEAKLLQYLAYDMDPDFSIRFHALYQSKNYCKSISDMSKERKFKPDMTLGEALEMAEGVGLQFNYRLLYMCEADGRFLATSFFKENEKAIAMLEREGAVKINTGECDIVGVSVQLSWLELSKFGFDFVWECEKA